MPAGRAGRFGLAVNRIARRAYLHCRHHPASGVDPRPHGVRQGLCLAALRVRTTDLFPDVVRDPIISSLHIGQEAVGALTGDATVLVVVSEAVPVAVAIRP